MISLMLLVNEIPRKAVVLWALELAEETACLLKQHYPFEERPGNAVTMTRAWAAGEIKMPVAKRAILDCHAAAKELSSAADISRCHAVGQACGTVHANGHAIGFPIYDLTAMIRETGLEKCDERINARIDYYIERLHYWKENHIHGDLHWADFIQGQDNHSDLMELKFEAVLIQNEDMDAAYVEIPYDIKALFGKGRLPVNATFDGVPYSGQVVKMGTSCYIIGVTKQIRKQINKGFGDTVQVVLKQR